MERDIVCNVTFRDRHKANIAVTPILTLLTFLEIRKVFKKYTTKYMSKRTVWE
jgi:hypothetical protein